uniref:Retrovirus-related Pol polyprotein from transposon TNT 1-94 n=1 Tax=Cajanus cajan TaxID=3821 RepID=A0A151QZJ2_CAJCA|nr:hypothetical protein KK1_043267 [Cajanus cajan]
MKLPNGNSVVAHFVGTIKLLESLSIVNVLFLPQFTFNLIYISKLCLALNCTLTFGPNYCIIQEKEHLKKIGSTDQVDGLYYLEVDHTTRSHINRSLFVLSLNATILSPTIL